MKRILLVDDDVVFNRVNRKMIEDKLGGGNVDITEFTNPELAVNWIIEQKENLPDYIFLDIKMPLMDGWELLEIVEEELGTLDLETNIIIATDSIIPEYKGKALAIPCVKHFINKPLNSVTIELLFDGEKAVAL